MMAVNRPSPHERWEGVGMGGGRWGSGWQKAMVPTLSSLAAQPLPLPRPHQLMQFKQLLKAVARWEEGLCSALP